MWIGDEKNWPNYVIFLTEFTVFSQLLDFLLKFQTLFNY